MNRLPELLAIVFSLLELYERMANIEIPKDEEEQMKKIRRKLDQLEAKSPTYMQDWRPEGES